MSSFSLVMMLASVITASDKGPVVFSEPERVASTGQRWMLAIGVQSFVDEHWPTLRYTQRDAEALAEALSGNAFETELVVGDAATREGAVAALDALQRRATHPDDTVVVYVSTHGTLARSVDGAMRQVLVLHDSGFDDVLATGLELEDLVRRLEALPSQRKVLILATCYSGAGKSSLSDALRGYLAGLKGAPEQPLYEVSRASIILSASAWGQTAREDETLGHDIYTYYLLQALLGYDPNGDGATSVTEAHDFARQRTYAFSKGQQTPTATMTVEGEDPIVLAGRRTREGKPVLLAYEPELEGLRVRVDGTVKGALPGGVVVEPGWRQVTLESEQGAQRWQGRLLVQPGEQVALHELLHQEPASQLRLRVASLWLPRGEHSLARPRLNELELVGSRRSQSSPLVMSVALGLGVGHEAWRINQERFDVGLLRLGLRLGLGVAADIGRLVLHLDGCGGGGYLRQSPDSPYYREPRHLWWAMAGISGEARLRLSRAWSAGLRGEGGYLWGSAPGAYLQLGVMAGWSF